MTDAPPRVKIVEVGPRDGLQNYAVDVPTVAKIGFIDSLSRTGLTCIEATSFVNPKSVPKMADAFTVMTQIERPAGVRFMALVPNARGMERALEAGVDSICLFAAATEAFSQANLNASIDDVFVRFAEVADLAKTNDVWIRGYLSVAFDCPFTGQVRSEQALSVLERLVALGCDELSLADTTGQATSSQIVRLIEESQDMASIETIGLHLHDTYGLAIENVAAGYDAGVRIFDGSAGGIGGCPFSPGAPGNVSTEAVVDYFEKQGIDTGIDAATVRQAFETWIPSTS